MSADKNNAVNNHGIDKCKKEIVINAASDEETGPDAFDRHDMHVLKSIHDAYMNIKFWKISEGMLLFLRNLMVLSEKLHQEGKPSRRKQYYLQGHIG